MTLRYNQLLLVLMMVVASCKKQDAFLDEKPNEALSTVTSLSDVQNLLSNENTFNNQIDPVLGEIGSDDFYEPDQVFNSFSNLERNAFVWADKVYDAGANVVDWSLPYQQVYTANVVLDALPGITYPSTQVTAYNNAKGAALFFRSRAFYNLLVNFTLPYDSSKAATDLGIPLRVTSKLDVPSTRASQKVCYDQIINDLNTAIHLLPPTAKVPTLPSQAAAEGLLAKVYLDLGNYSDALTNANNCLQISSTLQDFNKLDINAFPFLTTFGVEDIFHSSFYPYNSLYSAYADTNLYKQYDPNDLRQEFFFYPVGPLQFETNYQYDFKSSIYSGIGTNEIYLIRAECNARLGNASPAIADLNTLLSFRYKTGTFVPYVAASAGAALKLILIERRKELWVVGTRWADLRRLSKDPQYAVTLTKSVNGQTYTLAPGSDRYAYPIPDNEISVSGIQQNAR